MDSYDEDEIRLYKVFVLQTGKMIFCPICHHRLFAIIPNKGNDGDPISITCGLCHNILNFNCRIDDIFELEMTYEDYHAPIPR